jgi:ABC-type sugar transport system permease subunit
MIKGDLKFILIGLAPALTPIFIFTFYPLGYALYTSTLHYDLKYPEDVYFVGFGNFLEVFNTYYFSNSARATAIFAAISVPLVVILSLALALLLSRPFRGVGFLQWLVLVPWAIPLVVSSSVWKWIFDSNYGLFNYFVTTLGFADSYQPWLTRPWSAMGVLILAYLWVQLPLPTLLFLAGIQSIPQELYEAAMIDGAKTWARFRAVTFTWLKPIFLIVAILSTILAIWTFDQVYVITAGGPADFTALISFYTYSEMFTFLNFGRASALAVLVMIVSIILIFAYFKALRIGRLRLRA